MTMLGIFAKPPRPGLVKTRLIPDIGADNAARVYRYCLEYTLRMARDSTSCCAMNLLPSSRATTSEHAC